MSISFAEFLAILPDILPVVIPILLVMLALMLTALISLLKKKLPFGKKAVWLAVILLFTLIGPVLYFAVGSKMLDEKIQLRNEDT